MLDQLAGANELFRNTIAQIGNGLYEPANLNFIRFCSHDMFEQYANESDIVITHAGVGSIITAVSYQKPVVVVPRRAALGEADNDHQVRTAEQFEREGLVLVAYSEDSLNDRVQEAVNFSPNAITGKANNIVNVVNGFIRDIVNS